MHYHPKQPQANQHCLFWFGLFSWFLPHGHTSEVLGIFWAAAATIAGMVWYVITKVMIWWDHG
jgi:hypothetical protein